MSKEDIINLLKDRGCYNCFYSPDGFCILLEEKESGNNFPKELTCEDFFDIRLTLYEPE